MDQLKGDQNNDRSGWKTVVIPLQKIIRGLIFGNYRLREVLVKVYIIELYTREVTTRRLDRKIQSIVYT